MNELSREHAAFTRGSNGVVVRDLGSKNGVQVNGVTVSETRLSDGAVIQMGPIKLQLADPEDRYMRDIEAQQDNRVSRPPSPVPTPASAPVPGFTAPAPIAAAHPHAPKAGGAPGGARKSRFARPTTPVASAVLDELHPAIAAAIAAERVPQSIIDERSRSVLHGPRGATFVAAAVLAGILAAVIVLVLGD